MGHAGAVYLGVDVTDQIGFEVEVLNQGQWVVGFSFCRVLVENLNGIVAAKG